MVIKDKREKQQVKLLTTGYTTDRWSLCIQIQGIEDCLVVTPIVTL